MQRWMILPWIALIWVTYEDLLQVAQTGVSWLSSMTSHVVAALSAISFSMASLSVALPSMASLSIASLPNRLAATLSAIASDLIQILSITPVLLISLFLVNLVLFYEFLRADPFSEQVRKGALLIMTYGAVLLWIYDPIVLGTVVLCVTLWGMIVPL